MISISSSFKSSVVLIKYFLPNILANNDSFSFYPSLLLFIYSIYDITLLTNTNPAGLLLLALSLSASACVLA